MAKVGDDEQPVERFNGKTLADMRCCRAELPHLRKSKRGRVVCTGGTSHCFRNGDSRSIVANRQDSRVC